VIDTRSTPFPKQIDRLELRISYRGKGATKMDNALMIHAVFARPDLLDWFLDARSAGRASA
jgi:hypothetical protein